MTNPSELQEAVLGGGCFWCTEAVYLEVRGVVKVESGYMGGQVDNPKTIAACWARVSRLRGSASRCCAA